jgi:PAS domain S-box-containing protein
MQDGIRVLHVDDEPDFAEMTAAHLAREDDRITVETATSVADGLALLTDDIDCVISDYDMPHRNGIEFLEAVRAEYPDLPFILFTGKGSEEVASDAISAGVTDYLQKEVGTDQYAVLANRVTNAVAQVRAEHQVQEERQRFQSLFERLTQPTVEVEYRDDEPVVQQVNPAFEDVFGYDAAEIVGDSIDDYIVPEDREAEASRINQRVRAGGSLDSREVTRRTADGLREFLLQHAVYDDRSGGFAIYTDITDRKRREQRLEEQRQQLEDLLDATRTLMTADSRDAIAARGSDTAREVIDLPLNGIYLYDTARETLVPTVVTDTAEEVLGSPPAIGPGDGVAWTAYETGEAQVYPDVREAPDVMNPDTPVRSECHIPIGDHGVLVAASTAADDFTDTDITSAKILAAHLEVAFDRVDRIQRQQEYLTALRALHETTQTLMAAPDQQSIASRAVETARTVLDQPINGVWLYDDDADRLEPVARTDESRDVIDSMPAYTGGDSLSWEAFETGEMQVYDSLRTESDRFNARTAIASEIVLPLGEFGVMNLGATEPQAFDEIDISLARIFGQVVETALDRAAHERELARSRELLRHTEDLAGTGGWEADVETGQLRWTQGTYAIHDLPPDSGFEPTMTAGIEFYHPDERERLEQLVTRCMEQGEPYDVELRLHTAEDRQRWVRTTGEPIRENGEIVAIRGAIQDITEQHNRERTLEQLVQRIDQLIDSADRQEAAKVAVDIATDVIDVPLAGVHLRSADGERFEGVAANDDLRDELGTPPTYSRADDTTASELVCDVFDRGEPRYIEDAREYGTLAEETPAESGVIQPLGDHGVFILSTTERDAFDETDRNLVELTAQTVTAALDRVEREADLRRREQRLQRERERLEQFTSVVSHDLRSPLSVVQGRIELARAERDSQHLAEAADTIEQMDTLISDLLAIAREGQQVQETEPTGLPTTVAECWTRVETADATLRTETDRTIRADPGRLKQLLQNLLKNSVEHNKGTVTVTVGDLEDGFYIADDGRGIPADRHDEVFETGYSTSEDGTGFGLNIVREAVEAHGWDICLADSDDGGARFEITDVDIVD